MVSFVPKQHGSESKFCKQKCQGFCGLCLLKISTGTKGIVATKTLFSAQLSQHMGVVQVDLSVTACFTLGPIAYAFVLSIAMRPEDNKAIISEYLLQFQ